MPKTTLNLCRKTEPITVGVDVTEYVWGFCFHISVTSSVSMRSVRLFLGQCGTGTGQIIFLGQCGALTGQIIIGTLWDRLLIFLLAAVQVACEADTLCGEVAVPEDHLEVCRVCNAFGQNCGIIGSSTPGRGIEQADFVFYISAMETERCQKGMTVAYAAHCQQEAVLDRSGKVIKIGKS